MNLYLISIKINGLMEEMFHYFQPLKNHKLKAESSVEELKQKQCYIYEIVIYMLQSLNISFDLV